jgi:hypothetical protein
VPAPGSDNLKSTGLAQNFQVGLAVCLKIPAIRDLKLAQILGQPCEFYLDGPRAAGCSPTIWMKRETAMR